MQWDLSRWIIFLLENGRQGVRLSLTIILSSLLLAFCCSADADADDADATPMVKTRARKISLPLEQFSLVRGRLLFYAACHIYMIKFDLADAELLSLFSKLNINM